MEQFTNTKRMVKMQTHYIKNKIPSGEKFSTELESLIYNIVPIDYLVAEEILIKQITTEASKEFSSRRYLSKEIRDTLANMIKNHHIKEIYGSKIIKAIF